jgi:hypothetical protein
MAAEPASTGADTGSTRFQNEESAKSWALPTGPVVAVGVLVAVAVAELVDGAGVGLAVVVPGAGEVVDVTGVGAGAVAVVVVGEGDVGAVVVGPEVVAVAVGLGRLAGRNITSWLMDGEESADGVVLLVASAPLPAASARVEAGPRVGGVGIACSRVRRFAGWLCTSPRATAYRPSSSEPVRHRT